ncbi:MAG: ATP-binding protein [bacterium]|uniref:ATP-binding protein n=1 Tax=Candidatus Methylomirabilis tolerans TaxID=3123416 RepID=A0AAJ1AM27_9BACT|nr:ATP-binding protein [Candidatus Methylomirabilis sp.]
MLNNPTYLGTVQDVQGATISIALDKDTVSGLAFINGHGYRIGQIGSFVRISIGFTDLFGIVSQVGAGAVPEALAKVEPYGYRWLKVQLIGEGPRLGEFKRGISQYPTIGDEAHLVTEQDLARIYGRPDALNLVRVGSLASAESIPALIDIDRLITRHSAVVGATGAGKSTTVVNLLASLSDSSRYPSARIIVLDIHGEYNAALSDRATIFRVNADDTRGERPLFIPYWTLSLDELLSVTPFRGLNDADRAALVEKIKQLKLASLQAQARKGVTADTMTVDTPVPFSIHRLWYELHRYVCSTHNAQSANQSPTTEAIENGPDGQPMLGDIMGVNPPRYCPITSGGTNRVYLSGAPLNIRRQIMATESLLRDTRYDFMFRPGPWCPQPTLQDPDAQPAEDIDALLKSWVGGDKPITILDLSGVPVSILMDLVGVLLRLLFDALFWARYLPEGGRTRPLLFVLEEAHAYLNFGNEGAASSAARRIVKEGRKYGLGAMVVSQRPSEIDPTILSQCGTMFAMRLANATDRAHVTGTVSDNLEGLFNMLPALRTGEAIIVGEAVHLPLRALIDAPTKNRRPDSHDPKVYDPDSNGGWNRPKQAEDYANVLDKWRSENPRGGGTPGGAA